MKKLLIIILVVKSQYMCWYYVIVIGFVWDDDFWKHCKKKGQGKRSLRLANEFFFQIYFFSDTKETEFLPIWLTSRSQNFITKPFI